VFWSILACVLFLIREIKGSPTSLRNYFEKIGSEYDDWSIILEHFWGPHIHHGHYGKTGLEAKKLQVAQEDMIDLLLKQAKFEGSPSSKMLDVGCGLGGSTRYISKKYKCHATGITLSSFQVKRATELSVAQNLGNLCHFQTADALYMPFDDNSFDLVWSLESGEHMPDKEKFISECVRVLKPGGKLIVATWCHRESPLNGAESKLLTRIYRAWALPFFISIEKYKTILNSHKLQNVITEDWTAPVHRFWWEAVKTGLSFSGAIWLLSQGPRMTLRTMRDLWACYLMHKGYKDKIITYGVLTADKK